VPNDGLIRYLLLGGMERVFLTSPKAISEAYVVRSYDYQRPVIAHEILSRLLGVGLLLAEGEEHRVQRKNLTPAFSYRHVRDLVPTFWYIAAKMARRITEDIQRQCVEMSSPDRTGAVIPFDAWVNRGTLDIIGAAGLGFDFGAVNDPNNELSVTYRTAFKLSLQEQLLQLASIFIPFRFLEYLPIRRNREVRDGVGIIRATSQTLIEKKQQEIAEKGFSEHKDILSFALQSGTFPVNKLVDQVMTFLAAGHETTATATQWAMVVLAQHPLMQERLRSEIREHLPSIDEDNHVASENFDQTPYLRAFCQEILRFWAPVPFTQREAIRDTQILGHHIPKGTNIVVLPSAMNHSKELWGVDAEEFKPERWLQPGCSTTGGAESPYANLTFGAGMSMVRMLRDCVS
jgi:cytochrome P450